jgi:hypothetical protein
MHFEEPHAAHDNNGQNAAPSVPESPMGFSAPSTLAVSPVAVPGVQTRLQKGIRNPKKYTDGTVG